MLLLVAIVEFLALLPEKKNVENFPNSRIQKENPISACTNPTRGPLVLSRYFDTITTIRYSENKKDDKMCSLFRYFLLNVMFGPMASSEILRRSNNNNKSTEDHVIKQRVGDVSLTSCLVRCELVMGCDIVAMKRGVGMGVKGTCLLLMSMSRDVRSESDDVIKDESQWSVYQKVNVRAKGL